MAFRGRRWGRIALVLCGLLLTGCSPAGSSPTPTATVTVTVTPSPPDTMVITVNALNAQGDVRADFQVEDVTGPGIDPAQCDEPSGSGVSDNTYACGPSSLKADACWRRNDGDLVCIDAPWTTQLSVRPIDGELPATGQPEEAEPLGLQLEDGSRYRHRNGPYVGTPPDGMNDIYNCVSGPCEEGESVTAVMVGQGPVINKESGAWTVLVGEMAIGSTDPGVLPKPLSQRVVRAWFVTAE